MQCDNPVHLRDIVFSICTDHVCHHISAYTDEGQLNKVFTYIMVNVYRRDRGH